MKSWMVLCLLHLTAIVIAGRYVFSIGAYHNDPHHQYWTPN
ncbi:hypothetical protein [Vibrio vulnificus]|nr:hypothetical protein [Vibrio vulnificus]